MCLPYSIYFSEGHRAKQTFFYKNKNEFKPGFSKDKIDPLYLTDFENIEVVRDPSFGDTIIKCTFTNGKQSLAKVSPAMIDILQKYLVNKSLQAEGAPFVAPRADGFNFSRIFDIILFAACMWFSFRVLGPIIESLFK